MSTEPSSKRIKVSDQVDGSSTSMSMDVDVLESSVDQLSEQLITQPVEQPPQIDKSTTLRRSQRTRGKATNEPTAAQSLPPVASPKKLTNGTTASISRSQAGKKEKSVVWTADHLLHSKRSKLIDANFSSLINPQTWALLSEDKRNDLLKLLPEVDLAQLPEELSNGDDEAFAADLFTILNNDAFKSSVRELQEDLEMGYWDPKFIKEAKKAAALRSGDKSAAIEKHKDDQFEKYWGQKQAISNGDAGDSANVTLADLCKGRHFAVGDDFEYRRTWVKGPAKGLVVEKNIKLIQINLSTGVNGSKDICTITFSMPLGTAKYSDPSNPDKEITISSLSQLENSILIEDGRATAQFEGRRPQGYNAWKAFRVYRNNEYLGSTFDIRPRGLNSTRS